VTTTIVWGLVAQENKENITIIILLVINWYKNQTPHASLYPDTHVLAYLQPDTLIYEIPLKPNEQSMEPLAAYILYIHHKNYEFLNPDFKTKLQEILNT
jgi:hypothetical protein